MRYKDYYDTGVVDKNPNYGGMGYYNSNYCNFYIDNVVVSDGITSIAVDTFHKQVKMTNIILPDSIDPSYGLPEEMFKDCILLSYVRLPSTLSVLKDGMFENCKALQKIDLPDSIENIHNSFVGSGIVEIIIPSNVNSGAIYFGGFSDCTDLTKVIFKGKQSMSVIASSAFSNCINLKDFIIPDSVEVIEASAFLNCSSLSNFKFDNIYEIKNEAFSLTTLKDIVFSEKLNDIGLEIFRGNKYLETIQFKTTEVPNVRAYSGVSSFNGDPSNYKTCFANVIGQETVNLKKVIVPKGSIDNYKKNIQDVIDSNANNIYNLDECKRILPLLVESE